MQLFQDRRDRRGGEDEIFLRVAMHWKFPPTSARLAFR